MASEPLLLKHATPCLLTYKKVAGSQLPGHALGLSAYIYTVCERGHCKQRKNPMDLLMLLVHIMSPVLVFRSILFQ